MDKDDKLFKDTSFSDLMSDIYHNSKKKDRQISQMIQPNDSTVATFNQECI
jgi:hypothetical protein